MTVFQNQGTGKRRVAFSAPFPGKIVPIHLAELGGELIAQKDSFLCGAKGVSIGIAFQRRLGTGFFGGEGFVMQRLQGDGLAFVHAGGTLMQRDLKPGEILRVDTGCVVAFTPTVDFDIEYVGNIKSALFSGEGISLPRCAVRAESGCNRCPSAGWRIGSSRRAPKSGGSQREEGIGFGRFRAVVPEPVSGPPTRKVLPSAGRVAPWRWI